MTWRMIQVDDNIPTITITVEEYMHLRECEAECNYNTSVDKSEVLDKIRAEIKTKYGQCKLVEYSVQYDGICTRRNEMGDIADILQIIDRHKAESE